MLASERIRQALLDAKAQEDPGRRVDGQRRRIGRLLGLDPGRLHLRRAVDHHRVDRRVRRPAELPGHAAEARHRRRRREDDAAVGRAGPAQGPLARGQPADPDRRRVDVRAASSTSSPQSRHKTPAAGRPDRAGPRVGRRHGAPARPGRRLRRNGRGDRQGGRSSPSSATSAASAISSRRRASATSCSQSLASERR